MSMARLSRSLIFLVLVSCLLLAGSVRAQQGLNITRILEPYPNFSLFNQWLNLTGVAKEVDNRTSLTILATPNTVLQPYVTGAGGANTSAVADTLRYQILLTYFGMPELQKIPVKNHTAVTTLLQTTGKYSDSQGFVNVYNTGSQFLVGHFVPDSYGNETIVGNVTQKSFEYSVLELSSILLPPPASTLAPSPAPAKANATAAPAIPAIPLNASALGPTAAPALGNGDSSHAIASSISTPLVLGTCILASLMATAAHTL